MSVETPKKPGIVTLATVVYSVLNELEEYNTHSFERYLQFAIECLADLNMYHTKEVQVAYVTMNDSGVIDIAEEIPDFIDYVKIGIVKSGKIFILGHNPNIALRRDEISASAESGIYGSNDTSDLYSGSYYFIDHIRDSRFISGLYGVSGGFTRSDYRYDPERRQFQFDTSVSNDEVVIEYISSGLNNSGTTNIKRQFIEPIKAYIHWKRTEFDQRQPLALKERRKRIYEEELSKLRHFEFSFTVQEFADLMYRGTTQVPKR